MADFFNIVNALFGGGPTPVPATVPFEVEWNGVTDRGSIADATNDFALTFVDVSATMTWTATSGGAIYSSAGPSSGAFAIVGKERNGVFFG